MPASKSGPKKAANVASLAKISPPRLREAVFRERLFARLDGLTEPVVWLSGPPGAGKTTLLASYLQQVSERTDAPAPFWMQLDAGDGQPSNFYHYLRQAIRRTTDGTLLVPESSDRRDWTAFGQRFARQVFELDGIARHWVFDNVHELTDSDTIEALATFVAEAPADMRFYFLSHRGPPPAFAELAARGRLAQIGPESLQFDEAETLSMVRILAPALLETGTEPCDEIARLSKGWAAGIVLLAMRRAGTAEPLEIEDLQEFPEMFAFFARQVYRKLSPDARTVLESCCWFQEFDAATAAAASGIRSARRVLDSLHAEGFFVERSSLAAAGSRKDAGRYRFHNLFREFLRAQSASRLSDEQLLQARMQATALMEQAGDWEAAINGHLACRQWPAAAALICRHAEAMLAENRQEPLLDWIRQVWDGEPALRQDPWLLYWCGAAESDRDEELSRTHLLQALAIFQEQHNNEGAAIVAATAVCAMTTTWVSTRDVEQWLDAATAAFSPSLAFGSAHRELVVLTGLIYGHVLTAKRYEQVERTIARIHALQDAEISPALRSDSVLALLSIADQTRSYEEVLGIIHRTNREMERQRVNPAVLLNWHFGLAASYSNAAYTLAQMSYLLKSRQYLASAKEIAQKFDIRSHYSRIAGVEYQLARGEGDMIAAGLAIAASEAALKFCPERYHGFHFQRTAQFALLQNNPQEALRCIHVAIRCERAAGSGKYFLDVNLVTLATSYYRSGDFDNALKSIDEALEVAPAGRARVHQTVRAFYLAHNAMVRGHAEAHGLAADFFAGLVAIQHYNAMLFAAPELAYLCAAALRMGIETAFVREMVKRRKFAPPDNADQTWPWPLQVFALGRFSVLANGEPVTFDGRAQRKPMEMLRLLAANSRPGQREDGVPIERVMDDLWPEIEAKDPKGSFDITLHRLRKLLGADDVLQIADGRLRFNRCRVWCDVFEFERAARAADNPDGVSHDLAAVVALYQGPLFGQESFAWSVSARERLAVLHAALVGRCADQLMLENKHAQAIELYEHALRCDNLVESFYRGLMTCHIARRERAEALHVYRRCRDMLSIVLGVKPAADTEELHRMAASL